MDKFGAIGAIDFASNVILDAIECNMSIVTSWTSWNGYNTTYIGGLVGLINQSSTGLLFRNIIANINMSGAPTSGAIVGFSYISTYTMTSIVVNGTISALYYAGGFVGQ